MKYALVITGVLAGLVLAAPGLVVIGYLFLIIPGLVLTYVPTVFVYLLTTAIIRRLLPVETSARSTLIAIGIAILLGWAAMQPSRYVAKQEYERQCSPDVIPVEPIKLHGHVRLELPNRRRTLDCDYLCTALLDLPEVKSVTVATGKEAAASKPNTIAYSLTTEAANSPAGLYPIDPGQIVREYPPLAKKHGGRELIVSMKAVKAEWAMRLCGSERLREVSPVEASQADWVIRLDERTEGRRLKIRKVAITDGAGADRFRKSYRKQAIPAQFFHFDFDANLFSGGLSNAKFYIARQRLESGSSALQLEPSLLSAIELNLPICDPNAIDSLREQVVRTLDNPNATVVQLDLAKQFLGMFWFNAKDSDHGLIERIVADERILAIDEQIKNVFSSQKTPVEMQDAYAKRIVMEHTSVSLRNFLAERLAGFPAGTFSKPTAEQRIIWKTPDLYQQAAPFIVGLADIDPEQSLPILNAVLDDALGLEDRLQRRRVMQGICDAMVRMGPNAKSLEPRIRELFLRRPSPIMTRSKQADQWRFAIARTGVSIENLPFFPNQSEHVVRQISRRITSKLDRYRQERTEENES
ncbi:hypothetical protein LOC67_18780 [Stieleria sp. JC731]|uniref:hypothetical protein n=1 Tax=Pirellulaceae TaxID=2691357 RepID=UPI001E355681|nr:hypothetical protein [Stieleria sp. JC731]MCC9602599.1 hypothetical protein [Stieleria sp. JC731]